MNASERKIVSLLMTNGCQYPVAMSHAHMKVHVAQCDDWGNGSKTDPT